MPKKLSPQATAANTPKATKAENTKKPKQVSTSTKLSALDAAAIVLAGHRGDGMTTAELIEQMSERGLWTSPGGKTPAATLYAAMLREITKRGEAARFRKVAAGRFAASKLAATRSAAEIRKTKTASESSNVSHEDVVEATLTASEPAKPAPRKGRKAKAGLGDPA